MNNLFRAGTLLVCLGFAAPAFAQTYDESPLSADSANCRAAVGQAEIDGTMQQIVGRACLDSDGTWQIVQSADGSALWYPVTAYPYPDPWWWGPPIFIGAGVSLIFVDHFHHFHHFDHFHPMGHDHFAPMGTGFHRAPFPGGHTGDFGGMHGSGGGMRRR
ncbi:hypothetical protein B0G76_6433 [Paraburkholderia sp. BL23I1N1]|uniref:hypothetical protein n=1 Tax=Paraburkholderia sp. BL23I1N1 TaxID=1938802 RepID=UPI000E719E98|nr:hypothetical protein [Paraburkholderia sp. BL23I1N1]RKE39975.1 hypothetical protein B0G76_6433 [Paraburkholderia sp. BL23I1N1]